MKHQTGDVFSTQAAAIGHGVNVDGVMGAGVAKAFKARYPEMFRAYSQACRSGTLGVGGFLPWYSEPDKRWVYNLASQDRPGPRAKAKWVQHAAEQALAHADHVGVRLVAIPQIGCGIGGLDWPRVERALKWVEGDFRAEFEVWTYDHSPA